MSGQISDVLRNSVKEKLARGGVVASMTVRLVRSIEIVGIAPFVRVPALTADYISRVLDGGALGVIAPHVRSAEDARAVVAAAKFPPVGERSSAGGLPHLHFRSF